MKRTYEEIAARAGVNLPPLGPLPGRWPRPLRTLKGPAWPLPAKPGPFLKMLLARRRGALVLATLTSGLGALASALISWAMGHALDVALAFGISLQLAEWTGLFLLIILLVAIGDSLAQLTEISAWMGSAVGAPRTLSERTSDRARSFKRASSAGDVLAAVNSDALALGRATALIPELLASAAAVLLVAVLMLRVSVSLGLIVIIGMPILFVLLLLIAKPLEQRQSAFRAEQGELTSISTDAVQGLRILRGIGGETTYTRAYRAQSARVRAAGIRVAPTVSLLAAIRSAAPMFFSVLVVAQGAVLVSEARMSVGQLLAFYGYTVYLRHPVWLLGESVEHMTRAWVGAKRAADLLGIEPMVRDTPVKGGDTPPTRGDTPPTGEDEPSPQWAHAQLIDPVSEVCITPAAISVILAPAPDMALRVCRRLARVDDSEDNGLLVDPKGTIALAELPIDEVRENILLAEEIPQIFAGTLRDALLGSRAPEERVPGTTEAIYRNVLENAELGDEMSLSSENKGIEEYDARLFSALEAAAAADVIDSLDAGLDGRLSELGRNLSGGQRQRLALARAYAQDAPILLLVEPTSALDSHTEAIIAERLPLERAGRTTVLVTESPILARAAERIIVLDAEGHAIGETTPDAIDSAPSDAPETTVAARKILTRRGEDA
ncbi:ABC transporter ATP-binding protein [Schaalia cardiffensis]|uniref:ABC transporter transmembrane domain-containing protein n=1 Tax=Schaalia cardiffensis TaxID=181487 RepID=UPI0018E896E6|nr:ABC transporter ATP-binding protein [Schaalia cardiffensis]